VSLINKMLQDLDARQTGAQQASHLYAKPIARRDEKPSRALLVAAVVGVVVIAVGAALGWRYWQHVRELQKAPVPVRVVEMPATPPAKSTVNPPAAAAVAVPPAPAVTAAQAPSAPDPVSPVVQAPAPVQAVAAPGTKKAGSHPAAGKRETAKAKATQHPKERSHTNAGGAPSQTVAGEAGREQGQASAQGKQESAVQKAEAAYRRAMASMQDGYPNEAIGLLEQALQANPRHDAARQTLVTLLIENKRADDAMRQLEQGLALDPRQPAMAMLLARLQIEHGGTGIDTLTRTLPYAAANGEYHAFLAGALQRQQRHREAVEQYQSALAAAPQSGVWWMGLGISLQAEKRDAEALDAFRKAKGAGNLSTELLRFVDNKIQLLAH
jgi:MSHA biogenesis protein MshN